MLTGRSGVSLASTLAALALVAGAGCSTGGEDPPAGDPVTFHGRVTYDFVPTRFDPAQSSPNGGLDFASATVRPVRGAVVRVRVGFAVLASVTTDADGSYTLTFFPRTATEVSLEALARTAAPPIQVEDNTDGDAVWAIGGPTEATSGQRDLHATHGWTGTAYDPARRLAAPFAILDSMYTAARGFLDVPRAVPFPPLKVNWSPHNAPEGNADGWPVYADGAIVTSHYTSGEIYILGKADVDTDEFDAHVIVHEWGHFFEANLSRADTPGGPHRVGDVLDPRLAFGEGYGSALASMLLPEPVYADTSWGPAGLRAFGFSAETTYADDPRPGPFSEMSVLRLLYDLWDGGAGEAWDTVALGLGPIHDVLVGPQRSTPALTTLASFVAALKAQPGVDAAAVDALLAQYGVGPIADAWGTGDAALRGVYTFASLPYSGSVTLTGGLNTWNKRQSVQYFVVTGTGRNVTVTASSASDVGLDVYRSGERVAWADRYYGGEAETATFATTAGTTYVVVLTGWEATPISYQASLTVVSP